MKWNLAPETKYDFQWRFLRSLLCLEFFSYFVWTGQNQAETFTESLHVIFLKLVDIPFILILSSKWIVCDKTEPSIDTGTVILGWTFLNFQSWQQTEIKQQKLRAHSGLDFPALPSINSVVYLRSSCVYMAVIANPLVLWVGNWQLLDRHVCQKDLQRMGLVLRNWKLRAGWKNFLMMGLGSLEFDCKVLGTHLRCGI